MSAVDDVLLLPPQNLDMERALIGSCMIDPKVLPDVLELVSADAMYREAHQWIFRAIQAVHEAGHTPDLITVGEELDRTGRLEDSGDVGYLMELLEVVPTSANAVHYAQHVVEMANLREISRACDRAKGSAFERVDSDQVMARLYGDLEAIRSSRRGSDAIHVRELGTRFLERIERGATQSDVLKTDIKSFDHMMGGVPLGLTILSGRTSEGKTTVATWWALGFAKQAPVLFVTSEVLADTLYERLVAMSGYVKSRLFRLGSSETIDALKPRLQETVNRLSGLPIWVLGHHEPSVNQIHATARRIERLEKRPLGCVIIDRLENLPLEDKNEVTNVQRKVRSVKRFQMEMQRPVLLLCQMRKQEHYSQDWRPQLDDLLGSSAIKQDAQMVVFVYRDNYGAKEREGTADLLIRKNSDGPIGRVPVRWVDEYPAFFEIETRYGKDPA